MQFEAGNRVATSGGGTKQEIIVKQGYDVGDLMLGMSGIIRDANNNRSSSGRGRCRIFKSAYHADLLCR